MCVVHALLAIILSVAFKIYLGLARIQHEPRCLISVEVVSDASLMRRSWFLRDVCLQDDSVGIQCSIFTLYVKPLLSIVVWWDGHLPCPAVHARGIKLGLNSLRCMRLMHVHVLWSHCSRLIVPELCSTVTHIIYLAVFWKKIII